MVPDGNIYLQKTMKKARNSVILLFIIKIYAIPLILNQLFTICEFHRFTLDEFVIRIRRVAK